MFCNNQMILEKLEENSNFQLHLKISIGCRPVKYFVLIGALEQTWQVPTYVFFWHVIYLERCLKKINTGMFPIIFPLDETISIKLNSNKLSNKTNPVRFIQRHFNKIWTKQDLKNAPHLPISRNILVLRLALMFSCLHFGYR